MAGNRGEYTPIPSVLLDGKDFQQLTERANHLFLVLKINMGPAGIEVHYPAALAIQLSEQSRIPIDAIEPAMQELERRGWIQRDGNVVWIVDHLQFHPNMKVSDWKHRRGVQNQINGLPHLDIVGRFKAHYSAWFADVDNSENGRAKEGPSKAHGSTRAKAKAKQDNTTSDVSDLAFERWWKKYPKRAGNNPKRAALQCWHARIEEGVTAEEMEAGLDRYIAFLAATKKAGTEFVQMAKTFLGPSRAFEQEWKPPAKQQPQQFDYQNPTTEFKGFTA